MKKHRVNRDYSARSRYPRRSRTFAPKGTLVLCHTRAVLLDIYAGSKYWRDVLGRGFNPNHGKHQRLAEVRSLIPRNPMPLEASRYVLPLGQRRRLNADLLVTFLYRAGLAVEREAPRFGSEADDAGDGMSGPYRAVFAPHDATETLREHGKKPPL